MLHKASEAKVTTTSQPLTVSPPLPRLTPRPSPAVAVGEPQRPQPCVRKQDLVAGAGDSQTAVQRGMQGTFHQTPNMGKAGAGGPPGAEAGVGWPGGTLDLGLKDVPPGPPSTLLMQEGACGGTLAIFHLTFPHLQSRTQGWLWGRVHESLPLQGTFHELREGDPCSWENPGSASDSHPQ